MTRGHAEINNGHSTYIFCGIIPLCNFQYRNRVHSITLIPFELMSQNLVEILSMTQTMCGWLGCAMVLGKLPVLGRPTIWMIVGQGPTVLALGAGGGCLDIFTLIYLYSPLSPSLWETARCRLKYCLKGPLNPKQPTNQPDNVQR